MLLYIDIMITGMKGKISSAEVSRIVLEVRDIFYEIWISFKTFEIIGSQKNRDIFIHIFHL
ncbi:MAG TPA: OB-fold domain-containing protein, partial [Leptospiraceae bacterium]|nr:OB-fold domain-containing protein [Leptospiraceae bacterium]